jgi:hypothetical protein
MTTRAPIYLLPHSGPNPAHGTKAKQDTRKYEQSKMPSTEQDNTITLRVTKEQLAFLQWISKQYGDNHPRISVENGKRKTGKGRKIVGAEFR